MLLLTWSTRDHTLMNQWAMDHATTLSGGIPLLALDMYEHSYHMDYDAKAAAYVDAFIAAINWPHVELLFAAAIHARGANRRAREHQLHDRAAVCLAAASGAFTHDAEPNCAALSRIVGLAATPTQLDAIASAPRDGDFADATLRLDGRADCAVCGLRTYTCDSAPLASAVAAEQTIETTLGRSARVRGGLSGPTRACRPRSTSCSLPRARPSRSP